MKNKDHRYIQERVIRIQLWFNTKGYYFSYDEIKDAWHKWSAKQSGGFMKIVPFVDANADDMGFLKGLREYLPRRPDFDKWMKHDPQVQFFFGEVFE